MNKLPFVHAPLPFCDFIVYAKKTKFFHKSSMNQKQMKNKLHETGLVQYKIGDYGDYEAFIAYDPNNCPDFAEQKNKFIFSGYLQYQGKMYIGVDELPKKIRNTADLENIDGYFTFAAAETDKLIVTQDAFGKNMIFYCIYDDFMLASNRYHLLLLYLSWLNIKPEINYDKVLLMMCSEDSTFSQQSVTRDMFFERQFMMTMTEKIVINHNGFHVAEKTKTAESFNPKDESEIKKLFEQGVEEIKENGRAVFSRPWKDGIKTEVTGGWDSRLSLASILSSGNRDFTVRTVMNANTIGDITVSELIVRRFDLKRGSPHFYPRALFSDYNQCADFFRSVTMGEVFQKIYSQSHFDLSAKSLRVGGDFGEIYKGYYINRYLPDIIYNDITVDELNSLFMAKLQFTPPVKKNESMLKRIKRAVGDELNKIPGELAQEKFNHHLMFYRLRSHFGGSARQRYFNGYSWSPATSLSAFTYYNSLPYHTKYIRHPSITNADLANAICPELSDIPFTKGGVGDIHYLRVGETVDDVTLLYKNIDLSEWEKSLVQSNEELRRYYVENPHLNNSEFSRIYSERNDLSYILKETLALFDCLASQTAEMAEILNSDLREHIKNRGLANPLNDYHMRLTMLFDMISIINGGGMEYSELAENFIDETPRIKYISANLTEICQDIDIDEIINYGFTLSGGEFADFSSQPSRMTVWQGNYCDESKVELFSMKWLNNFLNAYEKTKQPKYWIFCENILTGYFNYLIWGGMSFFEQRQMLPKNTEKAYADRIIVIARMLKLSPDCWFFCGNALRIVRQHADYLTKQNADNISDEIYISLGLFHATTLLKNEKSSIKYKIEAEKRVAALNKYELTETEKLLLEINKYKLGNINEYE